jgi:hypothetical protein
MGLPYKLSASRECVITLPDFAACRRTGLARLVDGHAIALFMLCVSAPAKYQTRADTALRVAGLWTRV